MSPLVVRALVPSLALASVVAIAALTCVGLRRSHAPSTARATGVFLQRLSPDDAVETEEALARDAFLREERFVEAVHPGHAFASTRVAQAEIEAGRWSSEEIFQLGAQLFHLTFTREVGFGARDLPPLARFHAGRRGGPDAYRCDTCHWRGGPAGAGDAADDAYFDGDGNGQSTTLARNPIALAGAGLVEILASEMTEDLARQRRSLRGRTELVTKGVSFGWLSKRSDGTVDETELRGIDPDLVVRPFGWKGNVATLRDMVEDSLLVHHGMQSEHLVRVGDAARVGAFGGRDPDGDVVVDEITEGQVTALTLFVAMQEIPQVTTPADGAGVALMARGQVDFTALGCSSCHVPSMPLKSTVFRLPGRDGASDLSYDLAEVGAEPRISRAAEGGPYRVFLYSDLKRHDLGPALAEPRPDRGVDGRMFLTRPLWGVARSRPYLHDGRAATLEDAILAHGGEAQSARDAYAALGDWERAPVRVFLTSLTRAKRLVVR